MKGFKYEKLKENAVENNTWGSYSDLFMALSFVFLMMYVVASLRSGTSTIYERLERQQIARENENLRAQMKAYDALKEKALAKESDEEQQVYNELMDKLNLLQDEARDEKNKLRAQAIENEKKEKALNKYQQIIRNIINANLLAKDKLKVREEIIENKNQKINSLSSQVKDKENEINKNNKEIEKIHNNLSKKISELNYAKQKSKITKEKALREIAQLKAKSNEKIAELNEQNEKAKLKVSEISKELVETKSQVDEIQLKNVALSENLERTTGELKVTKSEQKQLEKKFRNTIADHKEKIESMKSDHETQMKEEKLAFQKQMNVAKLTVEQKNKQLKDFENESKEKEMKFSKKIEKLNNDLSHMQAKEEARERLSKEISKVLKEVGVSADVDSQSGDVYISFGKDFFDSGSSDLKKGMKEILNKFIPKYSEALLKDKKISGKITSVEIVGFASPTYKGQYIDPNSLDPKDQKAVKYNLDLSLKRAKSIFGYIFDTSKIKYAYQKDLIAKVKVSGRSFFTEGRAPAGVVPGMTQEKFCSIADCKKAQKVIIKFNMDDKK